LNTRRGPGKSEKTLGIVARSTEDLARKLERALARLSGRECPKIKDAGGIYYFDEPFASEGKLAFVFPGEGAQYVNMLADLCRHFPVVRASFDAMDRVLYDHPRGFRLSEVVFPPPAFTQAERAAAEERLWRMDVAVEAVVVANQAVCSLLGQLGIVPHAVVGHSSGEYSALRAAGMVDDEHNDERIVELNDRHGKAAGAGDLPIEARLIAVGAAREHVESLCESLGVTAWIAMDNCRHQVVVIAEPAAAAVLEGRLREEGLLYERLSFDRPYHTPQFEPFAQTLRPLLDRWIVRPRAVPLYSCTSTGLYPSDPAGARQLAFEHWVRPVEFRRTIENMWQDGFRIFVESGPRGNLTAFIEDILGDRPFAAIPANVSRRSGLLQLHHLLAQLAAHGVPLTLDPLYERRRLSRIEWTQETKPASPRRMLGRVKLPTGAPEMGLSAETIELLRDRLRLEVRPAEPALAPAPAVPRQPALQPALAPRERITPAPAVAQPAATEVQASVTQRTATPHGNGGPRVMSAFLQTMDRFLAVEQELMNDAFAGRSRTGAPLTGGNGNGGVTTVREVTAEPVVRTLPLIETIRGGAGTPLIARCTLDLDRQPFLRDHTLGRNVSASDPLLTGFPIVPFTILMEIMAEAATAIAPRQTVVGMREVKVHRWLALDRGPLELEVSADWCGDQQISVRIVSAGESDQGAIAEGVVAMAGSYPASPESRPLELVNERAYKWSPGQLYEQAMFHGPLFRGVRSIDRAGDNGAEASLRVVEREGLLADQADAGFVTDFVLLDQPGQVVGFWTNQYLERGFVVLPFRMGALHLYGPKPGAGQQLTCRARIALAGDHQVRSDLDVVRADGSLWARFEDWEDRRFDLPDAAFQGLLRPSSSRLAQPWQAVNDTVDASGVIAFRIGLDAFPPGWLHAHGGMWARVLAGMTLSRRERAIWHSLKAPERRRLEWLLGRIAAKDAVRDYLQRRFNLALPPADVEILPEQSGRPMVTGSWAGQVPRVPLVSISHVDGAAVAVLADGEEVSGVGVDLERYGRIKPEMEKVAFSDRERTILDGLDGDDRQAWALRLWCAKEASAKAAGGEVSPVSAALAIDHVHREGGTVVLRYASPSSGAMTLSASTAREGDWIVATCVR
jgi:malonyl CoA-acyl carrier protein transacylase/phosphopantetheinyl transferase